MPFLRPKKDEKRHEKLVRAIRVGDIRYGSLNLAGVTEDFMKYNSKIDEIIANDIADSTSNQYFLAFNRFSKFCVDNNVTSLPSHPEVIMTYFNKIAHESQSISPVFMARSAIKYYNELHNPSIKSPTDNKDVSKCVDGLKRKFSKPVKKAEPMTKKILNEMVDKVLKGDHLKNCNFDVNIDRWQVVVKSIVKFHCFSRFEEVSDLKKSQFQFLENGDILVDFMKGKMNQFHEKNTNVIAASGDFYCPVRIIKAYFNVINVDYVDYYFLPKIQDGQVYLLEKANYQYCLNQLRGVLKEIGVVNWRDFGEHSDRHGGLSSAAEAGCSILQLQTQGRMKSDKTPKMYYKKSLTTRRQVSAILNRL